MIKSKSDLIYYLKEDMVASKRKSYKKIKLSDVTWRFQVHLRKAEYYSNVGNAFIFKKWHLFVYHVLGIILNYTIPLNTFGPGLYITHVGTIVISNYARIGSNCTINIDVNIGKQPFDHKGAPVIGNNVYIGPGAKIFGNVVIADNIAIGANSVVNKSVSTPNVTIAGVPAIVVSQKGTRDFKDL